MAGGHWLAVPASQWGGNRRVGRREKREQERRERREGEQADKGLPRAQRGERHEGESGAGGHPAARCVPARLPACLIACLTGPAGPPTSLLSQADVVTELVGVVVPELNAAPVENLAAFVDGGDQPVGGRTAADPGSNEVYHL